MAEAQRKRKLGDVFLRIVEDLGNEFTPRFRERFNHEVVPRLKRVAAWEEELTEEEYQEQLAQMRKELPGVIRRLQESDVSFSPGVWRVDQN
jgi:hypothetical protein